MKNTKYVACVGKRFVKIKEWDYDMSGYGGTTGTEYKFSLVCLDNATLQDDMDFPKMPYPKMVIRKVKVTRTLL